jgi:light-regulated signal transduction histidine kinase (bacteriophytochrome)
LELKNHELEQRNTELASFTYAASHDLKEPLRKIQVFSNRIIEKEQGQFSDEATANFNRILAATKRMQNLIISLLNYAQASEKEIVLVRTDLNEVLEEAKINFNEYIQDIGVIIESDHLPTLKVIPDQFVQLFSNIIGNAIKYRKPQIQPVIKINSTMVSAGQIGPDLKTHVKKYTEINFIDNGIGFDQQFAPKIFELFQRLHPKSAYEGAGIGLAICRKIMTNHNGFISAQSSPGIGTKISIYLPVSNIENE